MNHPAHPELDLMPPPFAEGLDDWSCGDGTPDGSTWDAATDARLLFSTKTQQWDDRFLAGVDRSTIMMLDELEAGWRDRMHRFGDVLAEPDEGERPRHDRHPGLRARSQRAPEHARRRSRGAAASPVR